MSEMPKQVWTLWNLRANWENGSPNELKIDTLVSRVLSAKIKGLHVGQLSGKWLKILRKLSPQKLVCEKSNSCKIQGMSKTSKMHAAYSVQDNVEDVEDIKTSHNRFLTDFLEFIWLLSKTSKILKQAITDFLEFIWLLSKTSKMYVYELQCRS